jgi:hypothetical protein
VPAVDGPWARAERRSSILNATRMNSVSGEPAVPKLPLGREPGEGSADWAHRCGVLVARLVPAAGRDLTLHTVGMPRPRTSDGWPMPFAGKDIKDPCATDVALEILCCQSRRCQLCGLAVKAGTGYAVRRPGHRYQTATGMVVPWVEGRALLHLACLRFSVRYCPELVRQVRQGVAHVVREPAGHGYSVVDGMMPDTREYMHFIEPVWHLEATRDSGEVSGGLLDRLRQAAATNAKATAVLFPRLIPAHGNADHDQTERPTPGTTDG